MDAIRVLVGNEPRAYREAIAVAFAALRPGCTVTVVEPAAIDREAQRVDPHLVLCSHLTANLQADRLAWVLLYPDGDNAACVSVAGRRRDCDGIELECLIAVIDEVAHLVTPVR